nr:MAG TPA: hypothetical protein [Caudoviricetes sp.]
MADAILMAGGTGGVSSDDVTATKNQVLQGVTALTSDSDDEAIEGTIQVVDTGLDNNNYNKQPTAYGIDGNRGTFYIDLPHGNGYYCRSDGHPHTCVDSDKLGNATADKVVVGSTFTSKNGVAVQGQIVDRGEGAAEAFAIGREDWNHQIWATFRNGWYHRPPHPAGHEAYIYIKYEALANLLGVDPAKMLESLTVADRRGQIKIIDTGLDDFKANKQNSSYGIDVSRRTFYIDFPHGNAYYIRGDGHPHACIDADKLGTAKADSILQGQTATSVHGVRFEGTVPRWVCNTGDVISAISSHSGQGFVYDDPWRGRGIVSGIPNGHYIQGANYVFLPSPNLQPWNIRQNVNLNGVVGTMVDYGAGGQAFREATFDGRLLTGVANKGFILNNIGRYLNLKSGTGGYAGIQDGGLKLYNGYGGNTHFKTASDVGFVFSKSINLTPFRFIKFGFKVFTFRGDGTGSQPARIELEVGATPISGAGGEGYHNESNTVVRDIGGRSNFATYTMTSTRTNAGNQSDMSQQYLTLDVSVSQGHYFVYIMLGNIVHEYSAGSVYAVVVVNNIEFIN